MYIYIDIISLNSLIYNVQFCMYPVLYIYATQGSKLESTAAQEEHRGDWEHLHLSVHGLFSLYVMN